MLYLSIYLSVVILGLVLFGYFEIDTGYLILLILWPIVIPMAIIAIPGYTLVSLFLSIGSYLKQKPNISFWTHLKNNLF